MPEWTTPDLVFVDVLRQQGLSDEDIKRRTRPLTRLRRGVYSPDLPADPVERHRWLAQAALATHRNVVLSHVSAALAWDLPVMTGDLSRVMLSRVGPLSTPHERHDGVRVFGSELDSRDVTHRLGLPVTSPERTILDCARYLRFRPALALADAAAHKRLLDEKTLRRLLSQMRGWKGIGRAREVLATVDPKSESPGESWTRDVLLRLGFEVESQFEVYWSGRFIGRADFRVRGTWVLIEFDGHSKYGLATDAPADALWREKLRHDALVHAGFEVIRLTWVDLNDLGLIARLIRDAIERTRLRGVGYS